MQQLFETASCQRCVSTGHCPLRPMNLRKTFKNALVYPMTRELSCHILGSVSHSKALCCDGGSTGICRHLQQRLAQGDDVTKQNRKKDTRRNQQYTLSGESFAEGRMFDIAAAPICPHIGNIILVKWRPRRKARTTCFEQKLSLATKGGLKVPASVRLVMANDCCADATMEGRSVRLQCSRT